MQCSNPIKVLGLVWDAHIDCLYPSPKPEPINFISAKTCHFKMHLKYIWSFGTHHPSDHLRQVIFTKAVATTSWMGQWSWWGALCSLEYNCYIVIYLMLQHCHILKGVSLHYTMLMQFCMSLYWCQPKGIRYSCIFSVWNRFTACDVQDQSCTCQATFIAKTWADGGRNCCTIVLVHWDIT